MFQNDMKLVKMSSNLLINDPPEETNSLENSTNLYMNRSVAQCEPELVVCHKESYKITKDICMDEENPTKDNILFERKVDEKIFSFLSSWSCENKQTMKENNGTNVLNPPATEESDQVFSKHYRSKDLMLQDEDEIQKIDDNVYKDIVVPGDKIFLSDLPIENSRPSGVEGDEVEHNHVKVASEAELNPQPDKPRNMIENVISSPVLELAVDELNIDTHDSSGLRPENGNITNQFGHLALGTYCKEECCQVGERNYGQTQNADVKFDNHDATNHVHNKLGESSSSFVGVGSSRINYSGTPFSGNISLRSDSSTTSTRSFSFPTLQPEWNSSPVRMAKPDRKPRGWKHHLLCCRF